MHSYHNPGAFLQRATAMVESGENENLFYAALEFRFCVEARLHEYAEHANRFAKKPGNPWKVGDLKRHVDRIFGNDDNVYSIETKSPKMKEPVTIEYTPVTDTVRTTLGRIENFLHYPGVLQCFGENKFDALRQLLIDGIGEMGRCLSGGLQGSLVQDASGHVHMTINLEKYPELQRSIGAGDRIKLRVNVEPYLKKD